MFEQVLPGNTKTILALLGESRIIKKSYLGGGTALALQLGHRISYDLDFFTREEFDEKLLLPEIGRVSDFTLERTAWRTILGRFEDVRFSFFYYDYPLISSPKKFCGINILDIPDIAAMKIAAVASRGVKRDFLDLYFICREVISLPEVVGLYDRKYKNLAATGLHIMKSLIYFDDAEEEEMPRMLKDASWEEIKNFFQGEVKKAAAKFIPPNKKEGSDLH